MEKKEKKINKKDYRYKIVLDDKTEYIRTSIVAYQFHRNYGGKIFKNINFPRISTSVKIEPEWVEIDNPLPLKDNYSVRKPKLLKVHEEKKELIL